MGLIKVTLMVFCIAVGCAYFIALLLAVMGRFIKLLGFKDDARAAAIPATPAGQIMPRANANFEAIAVAVAAAERKRRG